MKYFVTLILLVGFCLGITAQSDRTFIRAGNKLYRQQKFDKAEVEYRKAISKNPNNAQALYNLGCALMAQQKDSAAISQYERAGQMEKAPLRRAMIYHNIGVVCQQHQLYQQAIQAYEESLRNNPSDNETRYNLALCKRLMKNQPQKKNDQKQNNQKNKKEQEKSKEDQNKNQNQQNRQPKEQMSKDNAEQLLNAAMQQEKATQQRLKDAMRQPSRRQLQKNW